MPPTKTGANCEQNDVDSQVTNRGEISPPSVSCCSLAMGQTDRLTDY